MDERIVLSIFVIFLGFLTTSVECRRCFNSDTPEGAYGSCPNDRPKCCGSTRNGRRNQCAVSCVHFKCETNYDCDGLTCCNGVCFEKKNCLPVTPWGVVGIAIVSLFAVLVIFRACQWCHKRKVRTQQQQQHTTSEEQIHPPPFLVSDFENHGFVTPMAPPAYESVVLNDTSRTDEQPPIYNVNLQTIINNSSTNDTNNLVHEVNISIRGSTLFNTADFPPSYSEITSLDDDGEPPSYNSSLESAERFEEGGTISYNDEPPPYSLNQESPNNTAADLMDEDSTLNNDSTSSREPRTIDSPITTVESPITTLYSPITTAESPITTAESPITTAESPITTAESPITTAESPITILDSPITTVIDSPITTQAVDHEQPLYSNDDETALGSSECTGETSTNDVLPCSGINQTVDISELSSNSFLSESGSTSSQTATTHL